MLFATSTRETVGVTIVEEVISSDVETTAVPSMIDDVLLADDTSSEGDCDY